MKTGTQSATVTATAHTWAVPWTLLLLVPLLSYVICRPEVKESPEIVTWSANELAAMGPPSRSERVMAALVLMLSAYAWTTKRDLSGMGAYLMAGLFAVILAGLVGIVLSFFGISMGIFGFLLSVVTAILFSGFVMYDMQRLRNAREGIDDPIMMAVSIYLSIFNLFLAILRIFGYLQSSDD